jgi:hypothetical protein
VDTSGPSDATIFLGNGKWDLSLGHEWISELKAYGYYPTLGLSWHKILISRNLTMSRKMGFSWSQDVFRFPGFF